MRQEHSWWLVAACVASFLVLAGFGVSRNGEEDPAVRLERAIQLETVEGDLDAAIAQYRQIIEGKGNDRAIVAKALLRLGGCHERLGHAEARKAYQRLVDDYADQAAEVVLARQRLAALRQEGPITASAHSFRARPDEIVTLRVWTGADGVFSNAPSPDGRYMSYLDWESGNLAIRDLRIGCQPADHGRGDPGIPRGQVCRRIQSGPPTGNCWPMPGRRSAISGRASFGSWRWMRRSPGSSIGTNPMRRGSGATDWSPDGQADPGNHQPPRASRVSVVLISAEGGSPACFAHLSRPLLPRAWRNSRPTGATSSTTRPTKGRRSATSSCCDSSNGAEHSVGPASRRRLRPRLVGGRRMAALFAERPRGRSRPVGRRRDRREGRRERRRLVKARASGRILPMGLTRQGALFYGRRHGDRGCRTLPTSIRRPGGSTAPARKAIEQIRRSETTPAAYSPDGKFLAYVPNEGSMLPIPTECGQRPLRPLARARCVERVFIGRVLPGLGSARWQGPDGHPIAGSIAVAGSSGRQDRLRSTRSASRRARSIPAIAEMPAGVLLRNHEWSREKRRLFDARRHEPQALSQVLDHDLGTGEEKELTAFPAQGGRLPDGPRRFAGRWLAGDLHQ